jgi:tryptophanyl-tRNA synthetase
MKYLIGIQPTGKIHIGNYLGCLKKGLELQAQGHDVTFLIANYHSLTSDNFSESNVISLENQLKRLGCKNIICQDSRYTELFFKLCCKLSLPTLVKMPQYKDKKDDVKFDMGLLLYPVLMAADIIMNDPDVVIVGKDQVAHIDLCNDISKRVGGKYYKYEFGDVDKVMSLIDPSKKMSKSAGEKHVLYLFDEDYFGKLKKANMNEEGLKNIQLIAKNLGLDYEKFSLNLQLKEEVARIMSELFSEKVAYL